ncbi:methyl-accepting chemotaxis protein (plasmid) [Novosphingobium resinovorum]|uniref:methyl-accepting chemotaxis protein n=1 Tax=Novosphingobium TaxID=165696 RepID=UPI001B3C8AB6|nr:MULTISPECIES: methyl-accepting chemotaxis protein [Novosphingobium]MBF7015556.1 methyl-accepting chemotaxis protein [Novosphingobium sp. HR1a]WJM30232.1 methyl-accepting chemotaxis protein [Novosphingobium resinovorum]
MALVKKSTLGSRARGTTSAAAEVAPSAEVSTTRRPAARRKSATPTERIDQATQELASGLGEASAAAAELQRTMAQISSGAEEAAGAAQESLGLIAALGMNFRDARSRAEQSRRQTEAVQTSFAEISTQIEGSVAAIELSAQRQLSTVDLMSTLEEAAGNIDEIGAYVADVSDQTSLLALNAAIEAARAGDSGAGFSVVADEVRTLAENSEAGASDIRRLSASIGTEVQQIAEKIRAASTQATSEAGLGHEVVARLKVARDDLAALGMNMQDILQTALEAESATREAERGAEQVASAAEEQSAAAAEAQQAIEQQGSSLEESQQTAEALGDLTEQLQSNAGEVVVEQVAAAAEELSATVQELSGASGQILVALEQISRGTQVQASATLQANAAMSQIEKSARVAQERAEGANGRITAIVRSVTEGRAMMEQLVDGVGTALQEVNGVQGLLAGLNDTTRKIEKIADSLALISIQTNMLAVSGAVEATRAGDAGSGFAMVAGDIRKLSRDAADSAERTKDIVRTIQDQMVSVRRDLDQVVGAAEAEIARNRAMVERFALVTAELEDAQASNGAILTSADAMLRSVREVQSGTTQIAEAAGLAAAAIREASAAARQQAQGAEALAAAIEEIASIATVLAVQEN